MNTRRFSQDFLLRVRFGLVPGWSIVHKFGHSDAISTTMVPVASGNVYQVPTTAQSLELISDNLADNQAGIGARTVTIVGLDANWDEQTVTANMHATDGTIAEAVSGTWMRVYRMYVTDSGTYATSTTGSHQGTIDLQGAGGGVLWGRLEPHAGFPLAQSQIAVYTIPAGKKGYVGHVIIEVDTAKEMDMVFFQRLDANVVTAPYGAMRAVSPFTGLTDSQELAPKTWMGPFNEYTDIGFMAVRSQAGTSSASVDFEILIKDN